MIDITIHIEQLVCVIVIYYVCAYLAIVKTHILIVHPHLLGGLLHRSNVRVGSKQNMFALSHSLHNKNPPMSATGPHRATERERIGTFQHKPGQDGIKAMRRSVNGGDEGKAGILKKDDKSSK